MREAGIPDAFVVLNGPEDGAEFTMLRTPAVVGHDPSCAVQIRLDRMVQPIHAQITTVSDGYRVRCTTAAPVSVNGRTAGRARSRILRHGDILKIGHTELVLECAPDGLAARSRGINVDNDLLWLLKGGAGTLAQGLGSVLQSLIRLPLAILRGPKFLLLAIAAAILFLWPDARYWTFSLLQTALDELRALF